MKTSEPDSVAKHRERGAFVELYCLKELKQTYRSYCVTSAPPLTTLTLR